VEGLLGALARLIGLDPVKSEARQGLASGRSRAHRLLTLLTCGGEFDRDARHYRDNVIVYT
jgi:hypothetical protein